MKYISFALFALFFVIINCTNKDEKEGGMGAYMDFLKIIAKLGLKELAKVGKSGNGTGKLEFLGDFANLLKNEPKKIKVRK